MEGPHLLSVYLESEALPVTRPALSRLLENRNLGTVVRVLASARTCALPHRVHIRVAFATVPLSVIAPGHSGLGLFAFQEDHAPPNCRKARTKVSCCSYRNA